MVITRKAEQQAQQEEEEVTADQTHRPDEEEEPSPSGGDQEGSRSQGMRAHPDPQNVAPPQGHHMEAHATSELHNKANGKGEADQADELQAKKAMAAKPHKARAAHRSKGKARARSRSPNSSSDANETDDSEEPPQTFKTKTKTRSKGKARARSPDSSDSDGTDKSEDKHRSAKSRGKDKHRAKAKARARRPSPSQTDTDDTDEDKDCSQPLSKTETTKVMNSINAFKPKDERQSWDAFVNRFLYALRSSELPLVSVLFGAPDGQERMPVGRRLDQLQRMAWDFLDHAIQGDPTLQSSLEPYWRSATPHKAVATVWQQLQATNQKQDGTRTMELNKQFSELKQEQGESLIGAFKRLQSI
eukprot:scaffold7585_cov1129-Prasinococcus_capsulatus_cf.AAC.1